MAIRLTDVLSAFAPRQSLREVSIFAPGAYSDPDANLSAAQGGSRYFRRLTQTERDLRPIEHERALAIAYYLYDTNPLAKRTVDLLRDYILGDGMSLRSLDEDEKAQQQQQQTLDGFWSDPINCIDHRLFDYVTELSLSGELCLAVGVNPKDGHVRLAFIDPAQVADVVVDYANVAVPVAVKLKGLVGDSEPKRLKVISIDEDPQSKAFGRLMGAQTDNKGEIVEEYQDVGVDGRPIGTPRRYAGSCFYFRINKPTNAKRGRSDLLTVADWIDCYDQILFNDVDRHLLMKSFIWDVEIKGATKEQIDAYLKEVGSPRPGSVRAHNELIKWSSVTPDLKPQETATSADLFLRYIAAGVGLPKTWLGSELDVNKATAQEIAEPAFRRLLSRQRYVRYMLQQIGVFVLDQAELHNTLPKRALPKGQIVPTAWSLVVESPELRQRDLKMAADTMNTAISALAAAKADGSVDSETYQRVVVLLIEQLGIEVDFDAMRARIEQEKEEQAEQQTPPMGALPPGAPQPPTTDAEEVEEGKIRPLWAALRH